MPKLRRLRATQILRWAEKMMRPPASISPATGRSSPAMDLSVVVLPQPEGPSRVNSFPFATSNVMLRAACTGAEPAPRYSALIFRTLSS
jgi:hypothetical protein